MKRKTKVLIVSALALLLGLKNVNASTFTVGELFDRSNSYRIGEDSGIKFGTSKDSLRDYNIVYYEFKSQSKTGDFASYCLDPQKAGGKKYKVDRILGDQSNSREVQGYDMGLLEMMKIGYNQFQTSKYTDLNNNELKNATSIAIRAFTTGIYGYGTVDTLYDCYTDKSYKNYAFTGAKQDGYYCIRSTRGKLLASAHTNFGIDLALENKALAETAKHRYCASAPDYDICYKDSIAGSLGYEEWFNVNSKFYETTDKSKRILEVAKEILKAGLEKAADVRENGIRTASVKSSVNKNEEIITRDENKVTSYMYANIDITNFSEKDGILNNVKYSCPNCARQGITVEEFRYYNIITKTWEIVTPNINFATMVNAKDGVRTGAIRFRFKLSKNPTEGVCKGGANMTLSYNYYDSNIEQYTGALLKVREVNSENFQRFVVLSKVLENSNASDSYSWTINCPGVPPCETELKPAICSDSESKATAQVIAPKKVKTCVLFNSDEAGNSYQLGVTNGGVSNDYCSVFCKEDYDQIKLNPVLDNVVCGSYFKLKSHVEGKKECYTGGTGADKRINKAQYEIDVEQARKEMIDAYNIYSYWSAAAAKTSSHSRNHASHGSCSGGHAGCSTCNPKVEDTRWSCSAVSRDGDVVTKEWTFTTYDFNGKVSYNQKSYTALDGTVYEGSYSDGEKASCGCCSCSGSIGTDPDSSHKSSAATAKTTLETKIAAYNRIISNYNSCTTGWTNDYEFAQRIRYYYDEYRNYNYNKGYYGLLDSLNDDDVYYLEQVKKDPTTDSKVTVCFGDINDNYDCMGTNYVRLDGNVDGKNSNNKSDNYNSAYNTGNRDVFEKKEYLECTTSGCKTVTRYISRATYVKKTVEKKQDYITPTVFYQIAANGRITVNKDYTGAKWRLQALKNGLPVSLNSNGGGTFKLQLEDFGEFYETGELGRIFDYNGKNEKKSLAYNIDTKDSFDGNYVCYYENRCNTYNPSCPNCPPTETPWNLGCPNCPSTSIKYCINCIVNGDFDVNFRPILPSDVNANNRPMGYNWITSSDDIKELDLLTQKKLELLIQKATETTTEIENNKDSIYNEDKTTEDSSLGFSIRLTRSIIEEIRNYNNANEKLGGYANDSLTCYDANINGTTYKNMYCYSELIDILYSKYTSDVKVKDNRVNDEKDREKQSDSSKYWKLWTKLPTNLNEGVIGGPAWK